ncbi:hypothetical protein HanIR_Chr11g0511221 [Helianthus annuus]|nr:hypothetical protein HanIR_Chr11g0511221 [Helianthus annuus]
MLGLFQSHQTYWKKTIFDFQNTKFTTTFRHNKQPKIKQFTLNSINETRLLGFQFTHLGGSSGRRPRREKGSIT